MRDTAAVSPESGQTARCYLIKGYRLLHGVNR